MKKTIFIFIFIFLLFLSPLLSQENKLKVIAERVNVYLEPDIDSPVIETIERGALLNLLQPGKIQELWYYVSFYSEERYVTVSGFIYASLVEIMDKILEAIEEEKMEPRKKIEEVLYKSTKKIQVILEKANIRLEPDFRSEIIHQVQFGIMLLSIGKTEEWHMVNLPPDEDGIVISGYIHQSFVEEMHK